MENNSISSDKKSWIARDFKDNDFQSAAHLRKNYFGNQTDSNRRTCEPKYYRWKLLENPIGKGEFHVAETSMQLVGLTTTTLKPVYIKGQEKIAAEIGDTFTHPEFQRMGIFSRLVNRTRERTIERGINLVYGTPNNQSLPGYEKKLNFIVLPSAQVFNLVRPIRWPAVLQKYVGQHFMVKVLAQIISFFFSLFFPLPKPKFSNYEILSLKSFPKDIGRIVENEKKAYDWLIKKDWNYLNWRFIENPDKYLIWVAQKNEKSVGFLVAKYANYGSLQLAYLADFLVEEGEEASFGLLLGAAFEEFKKENIDLVATWTNWNGKYRKLLSRSGFFKYKSVPIIAYNNSTAQTLIDQSVKWHFTMADSDNI